MSVYLAPASQMSSIDWARHELALVPDLGMSHDSALGLIIGAAHVWVARQDTYWSQAEIVPADAAVVCYVQSHYPGGLPAFVSMAFPQR